MCNFILGKPIEKLGLNEVAPASNKGIWDIVGIFGDPDYL